MGTLKLIQQPQTQGFNSNPSVVPVSHRPCSEPRHPSAPRVGRPPSRVSMPGCGDPRKPGLMDITRGDILTCLTAPHVPWRLTEAFKDAAPSPSKALSSVPPTSLNSSLSPFGFPCRYPSPLPRPPHWADDKLGLLWLQPEVKGFPPGSRDRGAFLPLCTRPGTTHLQWWLSPAALADPQMRLTDFQEVPVWSHTTDTFSSINVILTLILLKPGFPPPLSILPLKH